MKIAIIVLGKPSSGKDTQVELLKKKFNLQEISSGSLISKTLKKSSKKKSIVIEGKQFDVTEERQRQRTGLLCTARFVTALVKKETKNVARRGKGVIFSGSPRKLYEVKHELPLIDRLYEKNVFIFYLDIPDSVAVKRALLRARKDLPLLDTKNAMRKRLREFAEFTLPVVNYLRKQKRISVVDGKPSVPVIHKNIMRILKHQLAQY